MSIKLERLNNAFTEEISKNGIQIFNGLEQATGLDIKSLLAGYLGGKLTSKQQEKNNENE